MQSVSILCGFLNNRIFRIDANARTAVYAIADKIKQHKFLENYKKALEERVEPYFYFKQELRNVEDALFD